MKDYGLRIMRGWIGALLCTCLAAASHTLVDGAMPPPAILGLLVCISAVICTALAGNKISLLRTSAAVLLSQGAYHGAFMLFGHHQQASVLPQAKLPHVGHPGHLITVSIDPSVLAAAPGASSSSLVMTLAHVGAALLTVIALRRGELAARALADAIFLCIPRLIFFVRSLQAERGKQPLLGVLHRSLVLRDVLRPVLHRRGPPRGPAFAIS